MTTHRLIPPTLTRKNFLISIIIYALPLYIMPTHNIFSMSKIIDGAQKCCTNKLWWNSKKKKKKIANYPQPCMAAAGTSRYPKYSHCSCIHIYVCCLGCRSMQCCTNKVVELLSALCCSSAGATFGCCLAYANHCKSIVWFIRLPQPISGIFVIAVV